MKTLTGLLFLAAIINAQTPSWRAGLSALPTAPPPTTTAQDVIQFEKNMRIAATYLGNASPNANVAQWEANRELVRRMAAYLYGLRALSGNTQLRGYIYHAQRSFDALGFAPYLAYGPVGNTPYPAPPPDSLAPPPQQETRQALPPFALSAPESTGVSDSDKNTAADLHTRYETDAAHSACLAERGNFASEPGSPRSGVKS